MENIPLRAYNRDIEHMIDNNQSQDALKHCQLILDNYPRCLETFRLMGKAYLELEQHDKAEETFQKVLSSIPDDFTANLGLSLLREKQNNLDGTIWHMERAYEAQPSNTAVQSELRRLYQQRDGVASSRIRLTRGALVRMYIRGDLTPQALNEIQSILNEDPSRIDIRILQATALLKAGKQEEALQHCQQIVDELPYCYEANRILFENPPSSMRIEEAQTYQQHLRELDPYYEFTSASNPDPLKVPEDEVKISIPEDLGLQKFNGTTKASPPPNAFETLTKNSSVDNFSFTPAESGSILNEKKEPLEEEKPAWLEGIEIATFQSDPQNSLQNLSEPSHTPRKELEFSEPMTTEEPSPNSEKPSPDEIPSEQPAESSIQSNPFLTSTGGLIPVAEPGEIPEWLRALASEPPAASSDAITAPLRVPGETGVLQTGEENLDFLRNIPGESRAGSVNPLEQPLDQHNLPVESIPGIIPADPFLVTSETTQPIPLEEDEQEKPVPIRDVPEWLKSAAETPVEPVVAENINVELANTNPQEIEKDPLFSIDEFQLSGEQPGSSTSESTETNVPTPEIEQYLEQLRKDISPGEQPDWLQRDNIGGDLEALFDSDKKPDSQPVPSDQLSDWKVELTKDENEQTESALPTSPISVPNVPDWLFTSEQDDEEDTAPIQLEPPVMNQPTPDWLKEVKPDIFGSSDETKKTPGQILGDSSGTSDAFNFSEISESEKTGEKSDQELDFSFLQAQPIDFLQTDRETLEDNLSSLDAVPAERLPADLAALLREETDKDINTNPLPDEEPVVQTFNPADFFNNDDLMSEEGSTQQQEVASEIQNLQPDLEPKVDHPEQEIETPVKTNQIKETGPVIPFEEIQPLEPVALFEDSPHVQAEEMFKEPEEVNVVQPEQPVNPFEEIQLFKIEDLPKVEEPKIKPVAEEELGIQFAADIEPVVENPLYEKPVTQETPAEKPARQAVPDEKPAAKVVSEPAPVLHPILKEKVESQPISDKKPVYKPKPVSPPVLPVKEVRKVPSQKTTRRVEKPTAQPVVTPRTAIVADLTRAREAVEHGDLLTALRRYIKLVNANKSLDHVSNDLKDLVRKNPKNYLAWQTYGDARLRSNRIQEALDAYAKAADLLK